MYDLAKAIQQDRRRQASLQRLAAGVPQARSLSLGRYRITVAREPKGPNT
jgi:hypothetical protein